MTHYRCILTLAAVTVNHVFHSFSFSFSVLSAYKFTSLVDAWSCLHDQIKKMFFSPDI